MSLILDWIPGLSIVMTFYDDRIFTIEMIDETIIEIFQ